jgi:hypothetical protein
LLASNITAYSGCVPLEVDILTIRWLDTGVLIIHWQVLLPNRLPGAFSQDPMMSSSKRKCAHEL